VPGCDNHLFTNNNYLIGYTDTDLQNSMLDMANQRQFSLRRLLAATCWICICFWIVSLLAESSAHSTSSSDEASLMRCYLLLLAICSASTSVGVLFGNARLGMMVGGLLILLSLVVTVCKFPGQTHRRQSFGPFNKLDPSFKEVMPLSIPENERTKKAS